MTTTYTTERGLERRIVALLANDGGDSSDDSQLPDNPSKEEPIDEDGIPFLEVWP